MSSLAKNTKATVIPCLRYRNAPAAIEWLCRTFGFEKHLVVAGEGDTIIHAQLSFGNGTIMLGSVLGMGQAAFPSAVELYLSGVVGATK